MMCGNTIRLKQTMIMIIAVFIASSGISLLLSFTANGERGGDGSTLFLTSSGPPPSRIRMSLSGSVDVYDAVDKVFYGKLMEAPGQKLGTLCHIGDINNDGINDIALVSKEDYSIHGLKPDGRIYIYYGNESGFPSEMDLMIDEADHVIMGVGRAINFSGSYLTGFSRLTSQLESGDYNNDGYQDLVMSVPGVYYTRYSVIIWGQEQGWPKQMIFNQSRTSGNGFEWKILSTSGGHNFIKELIDFMNKTGNSGSVHGGFGLDIDTNSDHMVTTDIDNDGYDDLISGGFLTSHNGLMPKIWATGIYWGDTGNRTVFYHGQDYGYFGRALNVGDIDGNGNIDLVIGGPFTSKEHFSLDRKGSVYTIFDLKKFKEVNYTLGECFLPINTSCDFLIRGSGTNDWFGNKVVVKDITGDGMDEIMIGAPYADGPANLNRDSGQIYTFYGRQKNGFAYELDADNDADSIIFGDVGYSSGPPEIMGDHLGNFFEIGDLNGDGNLEFVSAFPSKNLDPKDNIPRDKAGMILVYDIKDLIPQGGGIVQISNEKGIFTVEGHDMEDNLGFFIDVSDIDSDGFDDILFSSPVADGIDNTRSRCGEVYIIEGKGLLISDMIMSGSSYSNGNVFLGDGTLSFNIPYRYSYGAQLINKGLLTIDPKGACIDISFNRSHVELLNIGSDGIDPNSVSITWSNTGERGDINITIEPGWDLPSDVPLDIALSLIDPYEESIMRIFEDAVILQNDVVILDDRTVLSDGNIVIRPGKWFLPGETIGFTDLKVAYQKDKRRIIENGPFRSHLTDHTGFILDEKTLDQDKALEYRIPLETKIDLNIMTVITNGFMAIARFHLPNTGKQASIHVQIDLAEPLPPEDLILSSNTNIEGFSTDGNFQVQWNNDIGTRGDPNGSGLKNYEMKIEDIWEPVTSSGGLQATYFVDPDFREVGLERTEKAINFTNWGPWGPEPMIIPPIGFSARWHGWFSPIKDRDQYFRMFGLGEAKMILDGQLVQDWIDIRSMKPIGPFGMGSGVLYQVEVYYRNLHGESGIVLLHQDDRGAFSSIPENMWNHPSNRTEISTDGELNVDIRSVDWMERISVSDQIKGTIDDKGPIIDISSIDPWYNTDKVELNVKITDGDPVVSSGVEPGSIAFRTRKKNETWEPWEYIRSDAEEENSGEIFPVNINLDLYKNWKGYIQFMAEDRLGNQGSSPHVFLGIDMTPPNAENAGPRDGQQLEMESANFTFRFTDIGGSGVDKSSVMYRMRYGDTDWNDWGTPSSMMIEDVCLAWIDDIIMPGYISVQFKGSDFVGNEKMSEIVGYDILEPVINYPPNPVIKEPKNGSIFYIGIPIIFDAFGTIDDGLGEYPQVKFTWISSIDGYMGSGNRIKALLSEGEHRIYLYADDGAPGHNMTTWIEINITIRQTDDDDGRIDPHIEEKEDNLWIELIIISIIAAFILACIVFAVLYNRKKVTEEVRLGIKKEENEDPSDLDDLF